MNILLVHGIGHCEADDDYYASWRHAITTALRQGGATSTPAFTEFAYDDLFANGYAGPEVYAQALLELAGSVAWNGIADTIGGMTDQTRALESPAEWVRWRLGMVAQFVVETPLRRALRNRMHRAVTRNPPDIIVAHSLGSLLAFDYLHNDTRAALGTCTLVTFGSQIGNLFVRNRLWPGRFTLPPVKRWFHLFNEQDRVFTAGIPIVGAPEFQQIETASGAGHSPTRTADGPGYLDHHATADAVWSVLATPGATREFTRSVAVRRTAMRTPRRRALLIGINDYPDPAHRLAGCVNDAFLASSLLQERGFDANDIRVLLDARATASAIRDRIEWLFDGADDGSERVLFYSGHGAQLPGYSAGEQVDRVDECLVPWDFDWTLERAISDKDFFRRYSELPFSTHFAAILDCCHAGGMTRDGGPRIRGLAPPDDIRHRLMRWDSARQSWAARALPPISVRYRHEIGGRMAGDNGATYRLGRGMALRGPLSQAAERKLIARKRGLYLPVLFEACGEQQLAHEYRHGSESYGAFTWTVAAALRRNPRASWKRLHTIVSADLAALGYTQRPELVGPWDPLQRRALG